MQRPRFFPFFWMDDIWFLSWRGAQVRVRIGDEARRFVRVGAPWRLARYAAAPMTALWCEGGAAPLPSVPETAGEHPVVPAQQIDREAGRPAPRFVGGPTSATPSIVRVVDDKGGPAVQSISVGRGTASLEIRFEPAFPDVAGLGTSRWEGRWTAWVSGRAQFGGVCQAQPHGDRVDLVQTVDMPWDPGPQPLVASWVFRLLRVFRTWPTTYLWQATVDLRGDPPTMTSKWTRTSG
jgi:hypothetical protein